MNPVPDPSSLNEKKGPLDSVSTDMETTEGFAISTMSAMSGRDLTAIVGVLICTFLALAELDSGKETEISEVVSRVHPANINKEKMAVNIQSGIHAFLLA